MGSIWMVILFGIGLGMGFSVGTEILDVLAKWISEMFLLISDKFIKDDEDE